jgi:hypothetical protein
MRLTNWNMKPSRTPVALSALQARIVACGSHSRLKGWKMIS